MSRRQVLLYAFFTLFFGEAALTLVGIGLAEIWPESLPPFEMLYGPVGGLLLFASAVMYYSCALGLIGPGRLFVVPLLLAYGGTLASALLLLPIIRTLPLTTSFSMSDSTFLFFARSGGATFGILAIVALKLTWGILNAPQAFRNSDGLKLSTGRRFLRLGGFLIPLIIAVPTGMLLVGIEGIDAVTRGALVSDMGHLYSVETTYQRGSTTVVLLPMSHVANKDFYKDIIKDYNRSEVTLLSEGLRDAKGRLKLRQAYSTVAKATGLASQSTEFLPLSGWDLNHVNADVDAAVFASSTVEILNQIFSLYESIDPNAKGELLISLQKEWAKEDYIQLLTDVFDKRNANLLKEIAIRLPLESRILVPWGALHIADIAEGLVQEGFSPVRSKKRDLINYSVVLGNLRQYMHDKKMNALSELASDL